ncbi:hypothetical protein CC78DRAFT_544098 [Lojkania enalia]|uniref:Reticulocyte-binding protein 2 like protein a n=1 Tax=Lojkania enalia TaxID=147567 RepID=A0A9P4N6E2_9PLEO|nr:hypothetical protein CC78DRAFT_544098 [Didymosphaeria enalia]
MPPADFWDTEDEWYSDRTYSGARHVRAPPPGRRSDFLAPEQHRHVYTTGLHRTRSQGHAPAPNVTIYNTTSSRNDNETNPKLQADQRSPGPSPRLLPRGRALAREDEWALEDEVAEQVRLELKNRRSRSRSVHVHHDDLYNHDYDKWQLERANERIKEQEEKYTREKREESIKESIKRKMELKYLQEKAERDEEEARKEAEEKRLKRDWELKLEREEREKILKAQKAEEERKRIIAENTAKLEKQAREAKEAHDLAVAEYKRKRLEEEQKQQEERERIITDFKRKEFEDAQKAKKAREELIMQLKIEEQKKKDEEKAQWEAFLLKQKQKEQEAKEKQEKEEAELEEQMRKRLAQFGFQENQIQAMIKPEETAKLQQGMTPLKPLQLTHQPTYVKVHKDHLSVDTLVYYDIPYEYDRSDPNYIIILREMDSRETEVLFEHTRRLRSRGPRLLIEERHDDRGKPDYAWVRRRKHSVSPSRRRSSPKRIVGIKEMFF